MAQSNSPFYVTKNCSITSLFLFPFQSIIWTEAIGAGISNLTLGSRLSPYLDDSRQLKRSVFRGNISPLWSLGLGIIRKLLKCHSSLGQTRAPDPSYPPCSCHDEMHLVLRGAQAIWRNSFTRLGIEQDRVPGCWDTAGNRVQGRFHGTEFSLFCARPCRAGLLALWAPSCQTLDKVLYLPIIRVSASWCCADERSCYMTHSKHAIRQLLLTLEFLLLSYYESQ